MILKLFAGVAAYSGAVCGLVAATHAYDRPAPFTTCAFDRDSGVATIKLPYSDSAGGKSTKILSLAPVDGARHKGVSAEGVTVTYHDFPGLAQDRCYTQKGAMGLRYVLTPVAP